MNKLILAFVIAAYLLFIVPVQATIYVGGEDGVTSISEAITLAKENETIIVYEGIYKENVVIDKPLILKASGNVTIEAVDTDKEVVRIEASKVVFSDFSAKEGLAGIYLYNVQGCGIENNCVFENEYGIVLSSSNNNTITGNTANLNDNDGIYLENSHNNSILNNTANSNKKYHGISLFGSSNNIVTNNTIKFNNDSGISLFSSNSNMIYLNDFMNNTENACVCNSTNNIWNFSDRVAYSYKGKACENYIGNYWGDYRDKYPDAVAADGIYNTPYSINSDKDSYPLMEPVAIYFVSSPPERICIPNLLEDFEYPQLSCALVITGSSFNSLVNLGLICAASGGHISAFGKISRDNHPSIEAEGPDAYAFVRMGLDTGGVGHALKVEHEATGTAKIEWSISKPISQNWSGCNQLEFYYKEAGWSSDDISICIQDADDEIWCKCLTQDNRDWRKIHVYLTDFTWRHPSSDIGNSKVDLYNVTGLLLSSHISPDLTSSGGTFWVDEIQLF